MIMDDDWINGQHAKSDSNHAATSFIIDSRAKGREYLDHKQKGKKHMTSNSGHGARSKHEEAWTEKRECNKNTQRIIS